MAYPIAPWIPGPQDVAGQFDRGAQLGMEQLRLRMEAERLDRESIVRQQELAQTQAYQQAQIRQKQQELEEQQKLDQIKFAEQAKLFQAQQQFQQWMAANPDRDPAEGFLRFFPGTGEAASGYGALARNLYLDKQSLAPPQFGVYESGGEKYPYAMTKSSTGGYNLHWAPRAAQDIEGRTMRNEQRRELERRRDKLEASLTDTDKLVLAGDPAKMEPAQLKQYQMAKKKQDAIDALDQQIDAAYAGSGLAAPPPAAAPPVTGGGKFRIISQDGKPFQGTQLAPPAPAPAPAAPSAPLNIPTPPGFGYGLSRPPAPPLPQTLTPSAPGAPFLQRPHSMLGPSIPMPNLPTSQPVPLFDQGAYTPLSSAYGQAVRSAQKALADRMGQLNPLDLAAGAKRIGFPNVSYNADNQMFYGMPYAGPQSRDDFESTLSQYATEKNLNPFQ